MTASALSILFFVNTFCYTFNIRQVDEAGVTRQAHHIHLPFITWAIQDLHLLEIEKAIEGGYDLLTDKSREMGASWDHITAIHHPWLFKPDRLFLEISRVETDVDGAQNPRCLFVKHDYINKWLPEWMRPAGCLPGEPGRTRMHIINLENGSRIDGESSNEAAGSGDRRHAVLLDEFAKANNAEKIKAATADVTSCRLVNSTPWGAGTAYSKWKKSGQIKMFQLPWWEHPEKGLGRHLVVNDDGTFKIRSPWYDYEDARRDRKEMAQEIDMDDLASGSQYFDSRVIQMHRTLFARGHRSRFKIDFKGRVPERDIPNIIGRRKLGEVQARNHPKGPWRFWVDLPGGRVDQTKSYIFGIDISEGQGASNSVVSVLCRETREKIAEFADANTPPHELARIVCAAALWIGGSGNGSRPYIIWEANGPGWHFGKQLVRIYAYPYYFIDYKTGVITETRGKKYGWNSSTQKKSEALGGYRAALANGEIVNHSAEALDEALEYIYYENNEGIGPATLYEESLNARKTHGDRVIADMLTLWPLTGTPRTKKETREYPFRSCGYRRREVMKRKKRKQATGNLFGKAWRH